MEHKEILDQAEEFCGVVKTKEGKYLNVKTSLKDKIETLAYLTQFCEELDREVFEELKLMHLAKNNKA